MKTTIDMIMKRAFDNNAFRGPSLRCRSRSCTYFNKSLNNYVGHFIKIGRKLEILQSQGGLYDGLAFYALHWSYAPSL